MSLWLSKSSEVKPMGRTAAMMNLVKPKPEGFELLVIVIVIVIVISGSHPRSTIVGIAVVLLGLMRLLYRRSRRATSSRVSPS
jgi:hypothetical protein